MLRIGDAESKHQAEVHARAVIDRALELEEISETKRATASRGSIPRFGEHGDIDMIVNLGPS